jgi:hypothetical protein
MFFFVEYNIQVNKNKIFSEKMNMKIIIFCSNLYNATASIDGNLVVKAYIDNIDVSNIKQVSSKIGEIRINVLTSLLEILQEVFKVSINLIFSRGIPIGDYIDLDIKLGDVEFNLNEGYLSLQASPRYDPSSKFVQKLIDHFHATSSDLLGSPQTKSKLKESLKKGLKEISKDIKKEDILYK